MKYVSVVLAVGCLLSAVRAQWLETVIQLDSGANPMSLCYNSVNDKVYCANKDANNVTVVDAATNEVITTIPVGDGAYSVCYSAQLNKVYCSGRVISVIDGSGDSIVATIDPGVGSLLLFYNQQNDKLYGGRDDSGVTVIDCEEDSVVASVPAWGSALAFCSNQHNNKVYYAAFFGDHVGVIDGVTDSLLTEVPLPPGSDPRMLCYDPIDNKVYCSAMNGDSVAVIDGNSDSICAKVNVGHTYALCYSEPGNKVYVTQRYGGVSVIDGSTYSLLATIPSQSGAEAILFNVNSNKVFCVGLTQVAVIDASADTLLLAIEVERSLSAACYSPVYNRVYVASAYNSTISVIRDSASGVEENPGPQVPGYKRQATVLSGASGVGRLASSVIFDAMGRRVVNPKPGVYFVREEPQASSYKPQVVRKIVIVR